MDGAHMRDGQYGSTPLVDVATVSLRDLRDMNSAALRAAMASCLADDKEQMAAFQSAI
ncbi:FXSXX-COOH protein [Nonomuraea turkmeniaca]|uniref:FXSXX-COOH protein n=2 Tax=Nonomuraea turkmeniaca TaxID=103838 RepID=A0A5S4FAW8_9ACTN|nr:FXSXX-COOH protein [Nonomuraea turkmeniaca]